MLCRCESRACKLDFPPEILHFARGEVFVLQEYDGCVGALGEYAGILVIEMGFALAVATGDMLALIDKGGLDGDDVGAGKETRRRGEAGQHERKREAVDEHVSRVRHDESHDDFVTRTLSFTSLVIVVGGTCRAQCPSVL